MRGALHPVHLSPGSMKGSLTRPEIWNPGRKWGNGSRHVGGLVGTGDGDVLYSDWDMETSGQTTSAGGTLPDIQSREDRVRPRQIRLHKAGQMCQHVYGMHLGIARIVDVDLEFYQMREVPRGDSESTDMQFSETAPAESRARRPRCDPPRPVRPSAAVRTRAWH